MTAQNTTYELFMQSVLDDEDRGYPKHVSFVPPDQPWTDDVLWQNIHDGVPSVIVINGIEMMITPRQHPFWVRLYFQTRRQIPVRVSWRIHDDQRMAVESHVGRHPLADMRELALA